MQAADAAAEETLAQARKAADAAAGEQLAAARAQAEKILPDARDAARREHDKMLADSRKELKEELTFDVETKYLSAENVSALFLFGKDEMAEDVEINRLTRPVLMEYYNKAVEKWD